MTIPKIIHQIWLQGYDNIPSVLVQYNKECHRINDDFEHVFWDEAKITTFLGSHYDQSHVDLFNYFVIPAQKADFARYAILYHYGGIYLDMDMKCKKNLCSLLHHELFFTADPFPDFFGKYLIGIIGAHPYHPVFSYAITKIFERKHLSDDVLKSTGTSLFYDSVQDFTRHNPNHNIGLIDRKYLDPCGILSDDDCKDTCDECFVVHTNNASWSVKNRILKTLYRRRILIIIIIVIIILLIIYYKS